MGFFSYSLTGFWQYNGSSVRLHALVSVSFSNSPIFCWSTDVVFGSCQSSLPCKFFLFCGKYSKQNRIHSSVRTLRVRCIQTGLIFKFTINYLCSRHPNIFAQSKYNNIYSYLLKDILLHVHEHQVI